MNSDDPLVTIYKFRNISSSHKLDLPYESKCNNIHGHNYKIEVWVTGRLNENGMVIDFHNLKRVINELDHVYLNDIMDQPTTAENIALYFLPKIKALGGERISNIKIRVNETDTAYAQLSKDYVNV